MVVWDIDLSHDGAVVASTQAKQEDGAFIRNLKSDNNPQQRWSPPQPHLTSDQREEEAERELPLQRRMENNSKKATLPFSHVKVKLLPTVTCYRGLCVYVGVRRSVGGEGVLGRCRKRLNHRT